MKREVDDLLIPEINIQLFTDVWLCFRGGRWS